ncbi:MAG TPA: FAD-dependent oxidoreductase [Sphingopyxis sp.]|nr:FAD-dependent oxidoreductase [Sphingopyxis sp.]HMP44541.1 FAD-dependent oxidoreductase [Sphingopyxis sp.]
MGGGSDRIAIVGAGQAGGRAAVALRRAGYAGEILLFGSEALLPYERPPLSKAVLLGAEQAGSALVHSADDYREAEVVLRLSSRVARIDPAARQVELADGETFAWSRLILATGVRPRRLPMVSRDAVSYLRDHEDAERLKDRLSRAQGRLAIVGAGFIGLEVAASARCLGWDVTVVEQAPACLSRVMPSPSAALLAGLHRKSGVDVRCGVRIARADDRAGGHRLSFDDGSEINADLVVVGIGSEPEMGLAVAAGLSCGDGIIVEEDCRTDHPDIFAIGDVACAPNRWAGRRLRLESWDNAERQAERVACAVMGLPLPSDLPPWFWTDQYDWNVQMIGLPSHGDKLAVREGDAPGQSIHGYYRDDRLIAAILFNSGRDRRALTRLIAEGGAIAPPDFVDLRQPLRVAA